ncbi:hypothetical protein TRFO_12654 [Tritrichomonas foetus]|uniref:Leucine Rich Repeat family protein n=1 Tax=Tritrichomonas foetus TaxID=1144522 RepID=A0A1J4L221_9EUKA|nr:hypothetical protein TRFO_12654 [Tritrichomonas foetus]|eukprot:OHT17128.1 hypothetical protein TRFO_12654 [Tritrichomonas foetus]
MEEQVFNTILEDNLIDPKEFQANPDKFTAIECFHFNLTAHPTFHQFTNLTELRIMEQDVVDLEWLKDCPKLNKLIVFHTPLNDASGLKYSPGIETLYLEGNKFDHLPDLTCLENLTDLSLSGNPFSEIPKFPVMESIKSFNFSCANMISIDPSIKNFKNLEKLNISGNHLPDFSFLDSVKHLEKLTELDVSDPRYGPNPVCLLPNYETIVINALPQVAVVDTFTIPDKFRPIAQNRIREVEMYYHNCISSEITALDMVSVGFFKEVETALKSVKPSSIIQNISEIYTIEDSFQTFQKSIEKLIRESYQLSFESGGNISFIRVDENSEEWDSLITSTTRKVEVLSSAQLVAAWKINNVVVSKNTKDLAITQEFMLLPLNSLEDSVDCIKNWAYHEKLSDVQPKVTLENDFGSFIVCNKLKGEKYVPVFLILFSILKEAYLSSIDSICEKAEEYQITPVSNDDTLTVYHTTYELKNTLTHITLINCGISSLDIFQDLENVKYLCISNNEIKTLKNLPHLPLLSTLDVSFNKIEKVSELYPIERAATSTIENLNIYGNPVTTPQVLRLIKDIFPRIESQFKQAHPFLNLEDCDLDFNSLTVLDISNNFITSLSPLSNMKCLEKLYASNNCLEKVDFKSSTLLYADFSMNQINDFPTPSLFPNMTTLMINYNNIKTLHEFPTLVSLFVAGNLIEAIPYPTQFPNLCVLYIAENPLNNSPTDLRILYQFPKLKMLNGVFSTSQLRSRAKASFNGILFPEDLPRILLPDQTHLDLSEKEYSDVNSIESKSLQKLILKNNLLKTINWKINALPKLTDLNLSNNELQSFDFLNLIPHIRFLNLSANKLVDDNIKSICSFKLARLQELNLSNNSFRNVPIFATFPALESLDLSHNYILGAAPNAFEGIKALDLSYNSMQKLDNIGASSIISLDISHNRVSSVDEVYKLAKCTAITKFSFHDNPLGHRVSPRIRCLVILRSLKEMDGKLVTEADLAQAKMLLDQGTGQVAQAPAPQAPPGRTTRVNNVNLGFGLPALQNPQPASRRQQQQHDERRRFQGF